MKKQFSPEALAIWTQIIGSKGYLSSHRIQGLVDILSRKLGLTPVMVRYGDDYELFEAAKFFATPTTGGVRSTTRRPIAPSPRAPPVRTGLNGPRSSSATSGRPTTSPPA